MRDILFINVNILNFICSKQFQDTRILLVRVLGSDLVECMNKLLCYVTLTPSLHPPAVIRQVSTGYIASLIAHANFSVYQVCVVYLLMGLEQGSTSHM